MQCAQVPRRMFLYFTMAKLSYLENGRSKIFIPLSGSKEIIAMPSLQHDYQAIYRI